MKTGDNASAQRRGQHLRIQVFHRHLWSIDAVLGQVFGMETRAGGATGPTVLPVRSCGFGDLFLATATYPFASRSMTAMVR